VYKMSTIFSRCVHQSM